MNFVLDPAAPNAFAAAVQWVDGIVLGTVASAIAVIAVASIGFLLLSGRIDMRRAAQIVFGCFILFGASAIASGLMTVVHESAVGTEEPVAVLPPPAYPAVPPRAPNAKGPYDPYAEAALPAH